MSEEFAIDVRGMTKRFGSRTVVNGIDLQVRYGEIHGFLGPNGSGKTTFIRMLCGLLRADGGSGTCLGRDVRTGAAEIRRETGYMTQRFSFYEDLSIRENLDFVARMYGVPDRRNAVRRAIGELGLEGRESQPAGQLSGGWKQRLALAACLLHRPKLLLLDEPTAGVDPKARRDFWDHLHRLAAAGLTVLIATHYMDEAGRCHRLAYMAYGRLLVNDTVSGVIAHAGLTTWRATGPDLTALAGRLQSLPGVSQTAAFGEALHVSGRDAGALERAIAPWRHPPYHWEPIPSGLEDAFIHLTAAAPDNFAPA